MGTWVRVTVALAVAREVDHRTMWEAFEPPARQAGIRAQFAIEILGNQVRDSTGQAVCQLEGSPVR